MNSLMAIFFVLIAILLGGILFLLLRPKQNQNDLLLKQEMDHVKENVDSSSRLVHQQLSQLTKDVNDRLQDSLKLVFEANLENRKLIQESNKSVGERLDNAARVVGDVQRSLGRMEESTKQVFEVGKDISKLQEILRAPKLRGALGELFLGDLLAQVLPSSAYAMQYGFKSGEKVDAIIRSAQGLIAIDSKFPLENFVRILETSSEEERKSARRIFLQDVKKHIDKIASKYILPDEGTLEFALMYIPAENVYYEIMIKSDELEKDILRYAQDKRVFPVSPNSFYAYLQTIAIGLKGMQMESGVREVMNDLARLKKDFEKFGDDFRKIGTHLTNARGAFDQTDKRYQRIGDKLENLGLPEIAQESELHLLKGGE